MGQLIIGCGYSLVKDFSSQCDLGTKIHKMLKFLVLLIPSVVLGMPTDTKLDEKDLKHHLLNPELNSVYDEEQDAPITDDIFPDRSGFFTGHRIPLELFSKDTVQRLLAKDKPVYRKKYKNASDFRKPVNIPEAFPAKPPSVSPLAFQPSPLGGEFDKAYFTALDSFITDF